MEEGVQHEEPDDVVHFPEGCGRRTHAGERWRGGVPDGERDSGVRFVIACGVRRGGRARNGKEVAAWEAEPRFVDAGEAAEGGLLFHEAEFEEIIEIAEAPGDETKACDAKEGVEDLGVDFDPDAAGGVDVVAVFAVVVVGVVAHGAGGVAEEEEEHAAPGDDVEAVEDD